VTDALIIPFEGTDSSTTVYTSGTLSCSATLSGGASISTVHKKYGASSLYLDGSSGLLTISSPGIASGDDFTVEMWVQPSSVSDNRPIWVVSGVRSGLIAVSGSLYWLAAGGDITSTGTVVTDTWQHVTVSRSSSTLRMFLDGVLVGSGTDSSAFSSSLVCGVDLSNQKYSGYIDDLRITKGSALYTADFTPPGDLLLGAGVFSYATGFFPGRAEAYSRIYAGFKYGEATTWSFSCEDVAGAAWATEDKGSPYFDPEGALYLTYGVENSDITAKYGDTSIFFPSSGRVTFPVGAGDIPAYRNFSFEFWINFATVSNDTTIVYSDALSLYVRDSKIYTPIGTSGTVALGVWMHVAVCRKANVLRCFLDGQKFAESVYTNAITISGFGSSYVRGSFYLDSIGFSDSHAYYGSESFVPIDAPFYILPTSNGVRMQLEYGVITGEAYGTTITPAEADTQWQKTVLLLRGTGIIGSKNIVDSKGRKLLNQSDAIYSDAKSRNGSTSVYFNGSSAKLVVYPARNLDLIDGDFTIELWMYPTRIQGSSILDKWGEVRKSYALWMVYTGVIEFVFYDLVTDSVTHVYGPAPIEVNTWSFVSVCRYGDDYRVSINGVGGVVVTAHKTPNRDSDRLYGNGSYRSWDTDLVIGANAEDGALPGGYYQGYIEDLRITNGFARYANVDVYAVPTTAFLDSGGAGADGDPYWADVIVLCHFDEPDGTVYNIRDAKGHTLVAGPGCYTVSTGIYGSALYKGGLGTAYGSEFDLSTGDFTFETWAAGKVGGVVFGNNKKRESKGWQITYQALENPQSSRNDGFLQWEQWDAFGMRDIAISPLYPFYGERLRWHHIAVVRKGNDIIVYVDGVGASTTITRRPVYSEEDVYLGGYPAGAYPESYGFQLCDELRITRAARYTSDFKVPTGRFSETVFSYGSAVMSVYHTLVPAQVKTASTVPGAVITATYSAIKPLIIGKPSAEGPTIEHSISAVAASAGGGEGFPEDMVFCETLNTLHAHQHAQIFYMNDVVIAQPVRGISTRFGVTDVASAALASVSLEDALQLGDSRPVTSTIAKTITSALALADSDPVGVYGVVISTAINVADSAEQAVHQTIDESVAISSGVNTRQTSAATDALAVSGVSGYAGHASTADSICFAGVLTNRSNLRTNVAEAVTFHSALSLDVVLSATVSDDVALADVPTQTLLFQAIIQDHVQFKAFFASPAYTTWAMNTRNAAVTQYANFNFNSFAKMGERYLGANDQGLYWLDGDNDAGRAVNSRITTGVIQPNGNKLAGVQYAYLGMRGDGQFVITVTDEAGGAYNYTLTGSSMETARVAFGRGFKTRYFTFSLESQGQDFDLDSVEFITTEMARKIQR